MVLNMIVSPKCIMLLSYENATIGLHPNQKWELKKSNNDKMFVSRNSVYLHFNLYEFELYFSYFKDKKN